MLQMTTKEIVSNESLASYNGVYFSDLFGNRTGLMEMI